MNPDFLILAVLIAFSAFFSASETALISIPKSKVDSLVMNKIPGARMLKKLKHKPNRLLITVLVGNNVVNIAASAYAALLFSRIFESNSLGIATGVMTFLILIFGEISPKTLAHQYAVPFALFVSWPIYILQIILYPVVLFFEMVVFLLNKLLGSKNYNTFTEGEVLAMLRIGEKEGMIERHEKEFIENIFEFNDITVEQVMTPRVAVEALNSSMSIKEAVDFAISHSHSRIPVYEKDLDHIIGVISIKELLDFYDKLPANKKLENLKLARPLEVPFSKKINRLFHEFQRRHIHIAVVIDEFGGTAGIVTLEDLLEEIVGEIEDEFDTEQSPMEVINHKTVNVRGSILMEDVNEFFHLNFWKNERDTVNTMVVEHLGRFPREGEVIAFPMGKVTVLQMKKNIIQRARIVKKLSRRLS